MRIFIMLFLALITAMVTGCGGGSSGDSTPDLPPAGQVDVGVAPPMPEQVIVPNPNVQVDTVASGLAFPWDIAFPSADRIYVTERPGRLRIIENGTLRAGPYATINVAAVGEGGLMGIALDPAYAANSFVYLMYTRSANGGLVNRISRFTDTGTGLENETVLVDNIPAAGIHNGGIIRFGPDGMLYAGTGDTGVPESAQNSASLAGKILRMTPTGAVPPDNPFPGSLVYAIGFRNVHGLAWNPQNGELWATNHGPSGEFGLLAKDSVFVVQRGGNHGWPRVLGVTGRRGVVPPILFYPDVAVPPSGALFYTGSLMPELSGNFFFSSLGAQHLQRVVLSDPRTVTAIERWFVNPNGQGVLGRLRAAAQGPDGAIYVSTSNGSDDKVLRIGR